MRELLLPRTDTAVLAQMLIVFPTLVIVLIGVRRDRELRLLVLGVGTLALAWFGVRALH